MINFHKEWLTFFAVVVLLTGSFKTADSQPVPSTASKEPSAGTTGANFLKINEGARAVGMNGAYTAVTDDVYGLFYNPAGLSLIGLREFGMIHHLYVQDATYSFLGYAQKEPFLIGYLGFGFGHVRMPPIERTREDASGNFAGRDGNFVVTNNLIIAAYATKLSYFDSSGNNPFMRYSNVGAAFKFMTHQVDSANGSSGALDLGYNFTFVSPKTRLALAVQNIGTSILNSPLPLTTRIGVAHFANADQLILAVNAVSSADNALKLQIGGEVSTRWPGQRLAGRFGTGLDAYVKGLEKYSVGAGYNILSEGIEYQFDYAYQTYDFLGDSHHLSLTLRWGLGSHDAFLDINAPATAWLPSPDMRFDIRFDYDQEAIDKWNFEIRDSAGNLVKHVDGTGKPASVLPWFGRNDADEEVLMGVYSYQLKIRDRDGNSFQSLKKVFKLLQRAVEENEQRGSVIRIPSNVLFDSGSGTTKSEAEPYLMEALKIIRVKYPQSHILIEGHTDDTPILPSGKFADNVELSTFRAESIKKFLQDQGVDPKRISTQGYGFTKPVAPNNSEENKAKNRRVEIIILKTDHNRLIDGTISVDTVWWPETGPYILTDDLWIESGVTLTIMPGTLVRINENLSGSNTPYSTENTDIIVKGKLVAEGTPDRPILIEQGSGNNWGAVYFSRGSSTESRLSYCQIKGGKVICQYASPVFRNNGFLYGGGIEIGHQSSPVIENNLFSTNQRGITCWFKDSGATIEKNRFLRNSTGIYVNDFNKLVVQGNHFFDNVINLSNRSKGEIDATSNWWGVADPLKIRFTIDDSVKSPVFGKVKWEPFLEAEPVAGPLTSE